MKEFLPKNMRHAIRKYIFIPDSPSGRWQGVAVEPDRSDVGCLHHCLRHSWSDWILPRADNEGDGQD